MPGQSWRHTLLPDGTPHEDWLKENAQDYSLSEMAEILGRSKDSVRWKVYALDLKPKPESKQEISVGDTVEDIKVKKLLAAIKDKPRSPRDLSEEFDRSEDTIRRAIQRLKQQSYEIIETAREQVTLSTKAASVVKPPRTLWDRPGREILLGICSDSHIGSKWAQITNLRHYYSQAYEMGVRKFLFCGDLNAGNEVYKGQIHDIVTPSSDEQMLLADAYWPGNDYNDTEDIFLGGNHDFSFIRRGGHNAVRAFCERREDRIYAGFDLADIPLTPLLAARLWHPMGGVPYAYSYRAQKMAEEMAFEQLRKVLEKKSPSEGMPPVTFLFAGHLHIWVDFDAGPIACMQIPCFEGYTPYLKRKAKVPTIAGLVLQINLTSDRHCVRKVIPHKMVYGEIEDDYLNYPIPQEKGPVIEPLFQWKGENHSR